MNLSIAGRAWILAGAFLATHVLNYSSAAGEARAQNPEASLLLLKNDRIEVGVLPRAGGRVVLLRRPGGANILLSDPQKWAAAAKAAQPAATSDYIDYNGHEIWVGPQEDWWTQQSANPQRAKSKANWPPDPWLNAGNYEIVEQSLHAVVLRGPPSPICGLQLTKEVRLQDDGAVTLKTTAVNIRNEAVSWDLWSLTRLPGRAAAYVTFKKWQTSRIEFVTMDLAQSDVVPHLMRDGVFAFDAHAVIPHGKTNLLGKAFLNPTHPWIAAFNAGSCLVKTMPAIPVEKIHPSQAAVEIYLSLLAPPEGKLPAVEPPGMLELEFHSEYRKLAPGESMSMDETWRVIPYDGPDTADGQIEFLKTQGILKSPD